MVAEVDPYRLLGVGRNTSLHEVRQAYRQAALENHPDSSPADPAAAERKFRAVCKAYRSILATFGPAALSGVFDEERTYSPVDFARREGGWRTSTGRMSPSPAGRGWWSWPISQKVMLATVDETRCFVWFWALSVAVGVAVSMFAVELGFVKETTKEPSFGGLLVAGATGIAAYLIVLAGTIAAIIMTRKVVSMTVRLGLRLLPAPLRSGLRRRLRAEK